MSLNKGQIYLNIYSFTQKYELVEHNVIVRTEIEELRLRLYKKDDLLEVLQEIGFKDVNIIKTFDKNKLASADDEVFIYECRK